MADHEHVERTAVTTVLPCGDRALLVEVPAARTVLVVLDRAPSELDVAALRRLSPEPVGAAEQGRSWSCRSSSTDRTSPRSPG
jgi:hypothetical protein